MFGYDAVTIAITAGSLLAACALVCGDAYVAERRLRRWAEESGLTILSRRAPRFLRGPYTWTSRREDYVYFLTGRDAKGNPFETWVRIRGFPTSLWTSKVETSWSPKPTATPLLD